MGLIFGRSYAQGKIHNDAYQTFADKEWGFLLSLGAK